METSTEQSCHHQEIADVCRKRQESLQIAYQRQAKLQSETSAAKSRIAELEACIGRLKADLASNKKNIFPLRQCLLDILKEARREKGDTSGLDYCRFFGKCAECWLTCDDAATVAFETAGCNAATCSCTCHLHKQADVSFTKMKSESGWTHRQIESALRMLESTFTADTDPVQFLTQREKLDTIGEFARAMSFINRQYCATICAKWVRGQTAVCWDYFCFPISDNVLCFLFVSFCVCVAATFLGVWLQQQSAS